MDQTLSYLKLGSFQVWAEPWYIELTALPDIVEVDRRLERDGGCEVTHIGRIVRSDNSCFDVEEGLEIHSKLVRFLSFARGGSCGSIVLRGRHKNHDLVWELWGSPRVTPLEAIQTNWFDSHHGEQLAEVFPGFLRFWVRNVDCDRNRMSAALDWYCEALATDPPYTRIVLIQIVLERLARILSEGVSKGLSYRRQSAEHELDHGDVDPCLRGCAQGLVVFAQPTAPAQPGKGALHHPSAGQHLKLMAMGGPFHNFQCPAGPGPDPLDQLAGLAGIGPDQLQARTAARNLCMTSLAPSRSCMSAGWTTTVKSMPRVSTRMWRLRPVTCWPAS